MKNANRESVIENFFQRQFVNVRLNDVRVRQMPRALKSRLDRRAQIYSDHFTRAPSRCQSRMPRFAAAAFENDFIFEEFRLDGFQPAQKLLVVFFIFLSEMRPLPAEIYVENKSARASSAIKTADARRFSGEQIDLQTFK